VRIFAIGLFVVSHAVCQAAEQQAPALPEPLTLEYALSLAEEVTPEMQLLQADILQAEAGIKDAESLTGFNSNVEMRAGYVDPPALSPDQDNEDYRLGIIASKTLYDFGQSHAAEDAAQQLLASSKYNYFDARQRRRIKIMRRYFDVILADLQFSRYNEEMAVVFIDMDRITERRKLGQASDIEVLEKETAYQRIRHLRYKSQNEQRRTRALLAQVLNRPGMLPDSLATPELKSIKRKLAEVEKYQQVALAHNALLKSLQAQVAGLEQSVIQARRSDNPVLTGKIEAYSYSRDLSSNDRLRAGVVLEIPLWSGGTRDAKQATAQAALYRVRARRQQAELDIKQNVLETWLELDALNVNLEEMHTTADYRELYLDRSRALYEMEVKADLGDSMVLVTEAERNLRDVEFRIALAWERLDALTGGYMNLDTN